MNNKKYFLTLTFCLFFLFLNSFVNANCININTALKQDLEKLTGIGPALAQRIIDARPFSSLDDLVKVSGIAEKKLNNIKEQGLACLANNSSIKIIQEKPEQAPKDVKQTDPIVSLSYSQENPVNQEIEITIFLSNLKNTDYDLKIAIENDTKNISDVYNENQNKWQSSHYYLKNIFTNNLTEKTFKLKIKEDSLNFQGTADILIRIRESGKTSYFEFKDVINIAEPEHLIQEKDFQTNLAAVSQKPIKTFNFKKNFFLALISALFSGIIILIIKKRMIK